MIPPPAHPPVKLVVALMYRDPEPADAAVARMTGLWGPVEDRLAPFEFTFTDYYEAEMGSGLVKSLLSFSALVGADDLPGIKRSAQELEAAFAVAGRRRVNCDPGYITAAKLVLMTHKDFAHRAYVAEGVYADVHLTVKGGRFTANPWTYPDYRQMAVLAFLDRARARYLTQLAGARPSG